MLKAISKIRLPLNTKIFLRQLSNPVDEKSKSKRNRNTDNSGLDELVKFYESIQQVIKETPQFSKEELEEHARIYKEYQSMNMKRHNAINKDLTTKIYLQQDAIKELPEALRVQALIIDDSPPPADRPFPLWDTPPIKGFDPRKYLSTTEDNKADMTFE